MRVPHGGRRRDDSRTSDTVDWTERWNQFDEQMGEVCVFSRNPQAVFCTGRTSHCGVGEDARGFTRTKDRWRRQRPTTACLRQSVCWRAGCKRRESQNWYVVASSSCKDSALLGDRLTSVNDKSTRGLAHQEVVQMLKTASSPVTLGLWRPANWKHEDGTCQQQGKR